MQCFSLTVCIYWSSSFIHHRFFSSLVCELNSVLTISVVRNKTPRKAAVWTIWDILKLTCRFSYTMLWQEVGRVIIYVFLSHLRVHKLVLCRRSRVRWFLWLNWQWIGGHHLPLGLWSTGTHLFWNLSIWAWKQWTQNTYEVLCCNKSLVSSKPWLYQRLWPYLQPRLCAKL